MSDHKNKIKAIRKQLIKKIPILKDFQEIKDELDKMEFDEKLKNQLKLMLDLIIESNYANKQMVNLIEERTSPISKKLLSSGNLDYDELEYLIKLRDLIKYKLDFDLGNKIIHSKLNYKEAEFYTPEIKQEDFLEILNYFPSSFTIPVFAANIADILMETQGHHKMAEGIEDEIIKSLRKSEKILLKQDIKSQIQGYEVLGIFGLVSNSTEYYEKYINIYKQYQSNLDSKALQNTFWWGDSHYNNNVEILKEEYISSVLNPAYNLAGLHLAFVLATYEFKNVQEVLELFDLDDNNPIYKKLAKIKFK